METEGISFLDLLRIAKSIFFYLRSKIIIISIFSFLGGIISGVYSYLTLPVYSATISYVLETRSNTSNGTLGFLASQFGSGNLSSNSEIFTLSNFSELFKSRLLMEEVLISPAKINGESKTLAEWYIDFNNLRDDRFLSKSSFPNKILFPLNCKPSNFNKEQNIYMSAIISKIASNNEIENNAKSKFSNIYEMRFSSHDEEFSYLMLMTTIEKLSYLYKKIKTEKSQQNFELLSMQVDSIRKALNFHLSNNAKIQDHALDVNPALNKVTLLPSDKRVIDIQIDQLIYNQAIQNLELVKFNLMNESPLIKIIDSPRFPLQIYKPSIFKWSVLGMLISAFFIMTLIVANKLIRKGLSII